MDYGHQRDCLRELFDALPAYVFCVDADVRILEYNRAAARLLADSGDTILRQRGGEALACLHRNDSVDGCGRGDACRLCPVRGAVSDAIASGQPVRRQGVFEQERGGRVSRVPLLVSASPCWWLGQPAAVVMVEDISPTTELGRLVPVCMRCHKVRDDGAYWVGVEEFLSGSLAIDCTHGYCPECAQAEIALIDAELSALDAQGHSPASRSDMLPS